MPKINTKQVVTYPISYKDQHKVCQLKIKLYKFSEKNTLLAAYYILFQVQLFSNEGHFDLYLPKFQWNILLLRLLESCSNSAIQVK